MSKLRITEIFHSLQGESKTIGRPTAFVRLTGCPMRCHYCDTDYAFAGGKLLSYEEILQAVKAQKTGYVTVTGGEPLAQPEVSGLLTLLCDQDYHVSLETGGAMDIGLVDPRVSVVLDIKTPGSGELARNHWQNIELLKPIDQVKFVLCDRQDYDWARLKLDELALVERVNDILFSPSYEQLDPLTLAQWILEDQLPVRFQIQLHKMLWPDNRGH